MQFKIFLMVVVGWVEVSSPDRSWFDQAQRETLNRCGANCLQFCVRYIGRPCDRARVAQLLRPTGEASSLASIAEAARGLGIRTLAVRWGAMPPTLGAPAIIRVFKEDGREHFIVIVARDGPRLLIADVPHDPVWVELKPFIAATRWDGNALHLSPDELGLSMLRLYMHRDFLLAGAAALILGLACMAWYRVRGKKRRQATVPAACKTAIVVDSR